VRHDMRRLLLFALVALAAVHGDAGIRAGFAGADANGACVSLEGAVEGEQLTLVFAELPQKFVTVRVARPVETCRMLERSDIGGPYFALSPSIDLADLPWVAIAVAGASAAEEDDGKVVMELDGKPPRESFRVCASMEGLHYTIWSGAPLTGTRRWHEYTYLGYDVDPTCTDAEAADDKEVKQHTTGVENAPHGR
jgi:hypothetical protein